MKRFSEFSLIRLCLVDGEILRQTGQTRFQIAGDDFLRRGRRLRYRRTRHGRCSGRVGTGLQQIAERVETCSFPFKFSGFVV